MTEQSLQVYQLGDKLLVFDPKNVSEYDTGKGISSAFENDERINNDPELLAMVMSRCTGF